MNSYWKLVIYKDILGNKNKEQTFNKVIQITILLRM